MKEAAMLKIAIGFILGSAAGYGWYRVVGCSTGTCPLTSNPVISTIYGAIIGLLMALN